LYGDDALKFYKSLLDIYNNHPIFFNDKELKSIENGEEIIKQACNYLRLGHNLIMQLSS
jgi:hypothetical protein